MFARPSWLTRAVPAAAAVVLVAGAAPATASPADAGADAADWLSTQLSTDAGGSFLETSYWDEWSTPPAVASYADTGLTIDGNWALLAAGLSAEADDTADWIRANASAYWNNGSCANSTGSVYAGSIAKLAVFEQANGGSAAGYISELECLQDSSGRIPNQVDSSDPWDSDFSNTFTQSLAVVALSESSSVSAADAADYLVTQQCSSGAFRATLGHTSTTCTSGVQDVDSTAMAVQALAAAGEFTAAVNAVTWLETQQDTAGGYWESTACSTDSPPVPLPNTNSTALATQAQLAAGTDASDGQAWLEGRAGVDGRIPGCTATNGGQPVQNSNDVRATTQAVPALLDVTLLDLASGALATP
ncbi:hypothetical protein JL108_16115 [Aeromicrobium sp. YIM 150415]|uniref:hypothetical protein n=1 Tax=Aeromicrobium sp. YIM 150415 TaxID=2803912 RepID=UPI001962B54A|nr:hypothetical protein [Aeromicrobium sp. YIM 150415]MBM9464978.1 hypothetical protein [Aeromicrobium sp. YIM 150415]